MVAMLIQLLPHAFFLGNVLFDRYVVGDDALCIAQRRDDDPFDVNAAVFAAIGQLATPVVAIRQGFPHATEGSSRGLPRIEYARVLSHSFFAAVAGILDKCLVNILDVAFGVSDYQTLGALFGNSR